MKGRMWMGDVEANEFEEDINDIRDEVEFVVIPVVFGSIID